jgi:Holliday junction resolvase RusA-like endonuclease
MSRVTITIPGKPYGKKRPRFSRHSGRAYDPAPNAAVEDAIGTIALPHFPAPLAGPVVVEVLAVFAVPPSWSKAKRKDRLHGPHCQKPDGDNVLKSIKDALNRIAWADDGQVYDARVRKVWGTVDQTVVHIEGEE